jgi:hypothetical protein
LRRRRADYPGVHSDRNRLAASELAVNADAIERGAGNAAEIARRTVHADAVRVIVQYTCEVDHPPVSDNAAESAICYRTESVAQGCIRRAAGVDFEGYELFGWLVSAENRIVNIGGKTHGSLPRMKIIF